MQDPQRLRPVLVGTALAATVAIGYTLFAAVWAIWNATLASYVVFEASSPRYVQAS